MLNRTKFGILVVAVIALFFIISVVIGVTSVDTAAMSVDEQPAEVIEDNASVTVMRETTSPEPFMGDDIRQASLNWADYAEPILPESGMADNIRQASLNWADYVETDTQAIELPEQNVNGKPY